MAGLRYDLTGQAFGLLTVLIFAGKNKHGVSLWYCECRCGIKKVVDSNSLKSGGTKSCGCHRAAALKEGRDNLHKERFIHGGTGTREHHIWANMIYRCDKKTNRSYHRYGGRGIDVCARWRESFANFLDDMGQSPSPQHSIDRFPNNDGNYEPGNCRWATKKEQADNRIDSRVLEYLGTKRNLVNWALALGINKITLHGRLKRGWSIAKSFETPVATKFRRKNSSLIS